MKGQLSQGCHWQANRLSCNVELASGGADQGSLEDCWSVAPTALGGKEN
jgi:hypothetical protein